MMNYLNIIALLFLTVCYSAITNDAGYIDTGYTDDQDGVITKRELQQSLKILEEKMEKKINGLNKKIDVLSKSIATSDSVHESVVKRLLMEDIVKVAFDAILSADIVHVGQSQIVLYDRVITNIGGAYDINTGIFQAPVGGTYLFSWTTTSGYHASILTHLEKNGVIIATTHADSSTTSDVKGSATKVVIITLNKGDRVYIKGSDISRGIITSHNDYGHSGFSGTFLFP